MLTIAIDPGDQLRKGHASLASDLFHALPELVFKADASLVPCNNNRALRNLRPHGFSPRTDEIERGPLLNRCANNFNLWPEQHSQRRTLRVSLSSLSGDRGRTAAAAEGPWSRDPPYPAASRGSHNLVLPDKPIR